MKIKTVPHAAYLSLRAAFDSIATIIQGAYVNGQLPRPSDAELADLIIAEYSRMRAAAYEQGKRAEAAELKLQTERERWATVAERVHIWVPIVRNSREWIAAGLAIAARIRSGDTAPTDPDAPTGRADDAIPRAQVDVMEAKLRAYQASKGPTGYPRWLEDRVTACRKEFMGNKCDAEDMCNKHRAEAEAALADASPQPESAEGEKHARE